MAGSDVREAAINFCFRGYNRHSNFRASLPFLTRLGHERPILLCYETPFSSTVC